MDYLREFENHAAYEAAKSSLILPNVSLCVNENEVHYNPFNPYSLKYLTFVTRETGTFTLTIGSGVSASLLTSVSYSLDDGETWTTTNNINDQTVTVTTPTVNKGNKVLWKGYGTAMSVAIRSTAAAQRAPLSSVFSSTGNFNVEGNIMSLLYGDDFYDKTSFASGSSSNFAYLFCWNNMPLTSKVVSVKNLLIPAADAPYCYLRLFQGNTILIDTPQLLATTLATECYSQMFWGCSSLTSIPSDLLPATTLATYCYSYMFRNCTSLTTAPVLSATTLAEGCYQDMFDACTSLTTAPELPATTLENYCYCYMFDGCTSLTTAPELPATTLAEGCYQDMFNGCTSLTTAPELLGTDNIGDWAYYQMFMNCTSLTKAPSVLPISVIPDSSNTNGIYTRMFKGCTSLTTAPVIEATKLGTYSLKEMFDGCTNLSSITCLATDISATDCTTNWVNGVSSSGTFTKAASMSSWATGANGIPSNWTVVDAS